MTGHASPVRSAVTRAGRAGRSGSTLPPLRQALAERRELSETRTQPPLVTLRHYAGTSPGKLVAIMVLLSLTLVITGWYASSVLDSRTSTLRQMVDRTEPLAESAQVLYSSLSIADASANGAFLSGGLESPALRTRYADAIATAATSLITASGNLMEKSKATSAAEFAETRRDVETLAKNIPLYTGLVETARTNNRLGNPVGSAYLGVASTLMQNQILPAAQRLYDRRSAAISDPQQTLSTPPWAVYAALAVIIGTLLATARYLARRTRRRFNVGILAALAAILIGSVWLLASGLTSVAITHSARDNGANPLRDLTSARILTQQARSAETLSFVRRGDQAGLERTFTLATLQIYRTLSKVQTNLDDDAAVTSDQLDTAKNLLHQWTAADDDARAAIQNGDFSDAQKIIGTGASAQRYAALDAELVTAITATRESFRTAINTAQRVIGYTGTGIFVITCFAALAVIGGLLPRIRGDR